ncbi:MAG: hypothetical protein AAGC65_10390 [Mucilaginibacter sp.]|uniref:hypothetical protein n=1 Tax=Mucilaginibacter sp. TaxID=1882438 RepID=UPI0031A993F7
MKPEANHPFDKLGKPAQRALAGAGIKTLEDLSKLTQAEFMHLHGIGNKTLKILNVIMEEQRLSFAAEISK